MKKLFIALLSSGISISSFAINSSYFDGFYAGLSGGATQNQMKLDRNVDISYFFLIFEEQYHSISSGRIYREVPFGELDMGYGHKLWESPFYLGADIFGNLSRRQIRAKPGNTFSEQPGEVSTGNISQTTITKLRLNPFEYGVDLRPGILLSPYSLLYARVGAVFNKLRMNTNGTFSIEDIIGGGTALTTLSAANNKNVTGLRLGLGTAQMLFPHWALTADYIYTDYGRISTLKTVEVLNIVTPPIPTFYTGHVKTQLNTQTIMLGVNYYFDPNPCEVSPGITDYDTSFFNNFYAGIKGGAVQNQISRTIRYNADFELANLPPHSLGLSKEANHYSNSGIGELLIGYGHLLENSLFYLGGEIFADGGGHDIGTRNINIINIAVPPDSERDILSTRTHTRLDSIEYGADVKPGMLLGCKTLFYGRLGIAFNTLKIQSSNTFIFENFFAPTAPPALISSLPLSTSKTVTGLRLGLGLEEALSDHLSANFDYIYTDYGKINLNGATDVQSIGIDGETGLPFIFTIPNGLTTQIKGEFTTEEELVGLTYHFS